MDRLTKKARRAAALKGWRNRTRKAPKRGNPPGYSWKFVRLVKGRTYDVGKLEFMGWTKGDGEPTDGYSFYDYFDRDGRYLGPDEHRIAPLARAKRSNPPKGYIPCKAVKIVRNRGRVEIRVKR